jgi:2-enoate reductase
MQGKCVTIVEAKPELVGGGEDMCFANYDMLKDLLAFHKVGVHVNSTVKTVEDDGVVVQTPEGEQTFKADTVMVAVGYRPDTALYDSIASETGMLVYNIGDSREVHNIMNAIWDAYLLAREI